MYIKHMYTFMPKSQPGIMRYSALIWAGLFYMLAHLPDTIGSFDRYYINGARTRWDFRFSGTGIFPVFSRASRRHHKSRSRFRSRVFPIFGALIIYLFLRCVHTSFMLSLFLLCLTILSWSSVPHTYNNIGLIGIYFKLENYIMFIKFF